MKEDCHICGVTFDSSESDYEDVCGGCSDELGAEGLKPSVKIPVFDQYPL